MFSWGFPDTQAVHVRFPVMTRHPITLSEAAEPLSLPNSVFARIVLFVGTCNLKEQLPLHDCALVCRGWYTAVRATHSVLLHQWILSQWRTIQTVRGNHAQFACL